MYLFPAPRAPHPPLGDPRCSKDQPRRTTVAFQIRHVRPSDWDDIEALANRAAYRSPDLAPWEDSLEAPSSVVAELDGKLVGVLHATTDVGPVAWVRMAAVTDRLTMADWIRESLGAILPYLAADGADVLAWMDCQGWASPSLRTCGFRRTDRVITLSKADRTTPQVSAAKVTLRRATERDHGIIAEIDRAAFEPLWWRSEDSVRHRAETASRFVVAALEGKVVGYAEREQHVSVGHVNRLAVLPSQQERGIGGTLLRTTLEQLWDHSADIVSLNTQATNRASRRLYEKFAFAPTGDYATVWTLALNRAA